MRVGDHPALAADVAGKDLQGVVGRLVQRLEAGIGQVARVAVVAVVAAGAAPEVRVFTLGGMRVEAGQGVFQSGRLDADGRGQVRHRIGLAQHFPEARLEPPIPAGRPRHHGPHRVAGAIPGIEQEPRGGRGAFRRVALHHFPAGDMVGRRFIHVAPPQPVDDQAARQGSLHEHGPGSILVGEAEGRRPPGRVHQAQGGSGPLGGFNGIAGVVPLGAGPGRRSEALEMRLAHPVAALEAAGGQNYAAASANGPALSGDFHQGAGHPALLQHQILQGHAQLHRHIAGVQRPAQLADQGIAAS